MANKFSFEDPVDLRGSRRGGRSGDSDVAAYATPKGGVPDFASFGNIDLAIVSPAIGVVSAGQQYKPMSRGAEYMFDEEQRERSFGENLVFYSGVSYLSGFGAGTVLGFFEGMRKGQNLPQKLRVNAIVNAISKRGQTFGNNFGVLALMFTSFERISMYVRDKDDGLNGINAAALTGALFKSTCGIRHMVVWSLIGGVGMTAATLSGTASALLYRAKDRTLDFAGMGGGKEEDKKE